MRPLVPRDGETILVLADGPVVALVLAVVPDLDVPLALATERARYAGVLPEGIRVACLVPCPDGEWAPG